MDDNLEKNKKTSVRPVIIISLAVLGLGSAVFYLVTRSMPKDLTANRNFQKVYSLSDISQHNNAGDCWMAISGSVYDVTDFIPEHPGGDNILLGCGKDATSMFNQRPNDGTSHSGRARSILENYKIGTLSK